MAATPTKYNDDNVSVILQHLESGHTVTAAFTAARVSKSQYYAWIKAYPEFEVSVAAAKNQAHITITNKLLDLVMKGNPGATIFWLKTRFPEEWRDKTEMIHSGSIGTYEDRIRRLQQRRAEKEADKNGTGPSDNDPAANK